MRIPLTTAAQKSKQKAVKNRCFLKFICAFLKKVMDAVMPNNHITNEDANGAAARIQGYDARLGFGITRIKNQIKDPAPISPNKNFLDPVNLIVIPLYNFSEGNDPLLYF